MSDFIERAEAEATRRALAESASPWADASLIGAGMDQFLDGVRWAERELRDLLAAAYTAGYRDRQEERDHDPGKVLRDV